MIQRGEQMHKSTPPEAPTIECEWIDVIQYTPNIIIDQLRTNGHVLTTHIPQGNKQLPNDNIQFSPTIIPLSKLHTN